LLFSFSLTESVVFRNAIQLVMMK